jgi:hypothetical protein
MNLLKKFLGIFKKKEKPKFGEIAVRKGYASEDDVTGALEAQKEYLEKHKIHKHIGAILMEKGVLTPDDVKLILEEQKREESLMAWFYAFFNLSH